MMTLDVSPEAWDDMIHAAERELTHRFRHSGSIDSSTRNKEDRQLIANAVRAALRVLMIEIREEGADGPRG